MLEDTKQNLEREKRRLREWRDSLLKETRMFEEKIESFEILSAEKDKKMCEHKKLLLLRTRRISRSYKMRWLLANNS